LQLEKICIKPEEELLSVIVQLKVELDWLKKFMDAQGISACLFDEDSIHQNKVKLSRKEEI